MLSASEDRWQPPRRGGHIDEPTKYPGPRFGSDGLLIAQAWFDDARRQPFTLGQMVAWTGIPQTTVSRRLKAFLNAGLATQSLQKWCLYVKIELSGNGIESALDECFPREVANAIYTAYDETFAPGDQRIRMDLGLKYAKRRNAHQEAPANQVRRNGLTRKLTKWLSREDGRWMRDCLDAKEINVDSWVAHTVDEIVDRVEEGLPFRHYGWDQGDNVWASLLREESCGDRLIRSHLSRCRTPSSTGKYPCGHF